MKKKILLIVLVLAVVAAIFLYPYYDGIYGSNTAFEEESKTLTIPTGSTMTDLIAILEKDGIVKDVDWFSKVSDLKKFTKVRPGKYEVTKGMSNQSLINKLRIGAQKPTKITFNSARTLPDIAGKITRNLELDSLTFLKALMNPDLPSKYGFNSESYRTLFIPNTYEMYWNVSAEALIDRLANEYKLFWNDERQAKAKKIGLSQSEVTILASIVNAESSVKSEVRTIAGLYMNRIKRGMPLESDPTLIFSLNDFSIKRVLNVHKEVKSPYNTYRNVGLPPGPIYITSPLYIDAVLDYETHDYIFMCAKPNLRGHNFAKTNRQHEIYAAEYRRAQYK